MRLKIALTGGPSAGKTTVGAILEKSFPGRMVLVPEAATILFHGGFARRFHPAGIRLQQQAIYAVQIAHEALYELEHPGKIILCDRGTLDGVAYWPGGAEEFFGAVGTEPSREIQRYDWVIHLETATGNGYDHQRNNAHRSEDASEARKVNDRVKAAWSAHPRVVVIPSAGRFAEKVGLVLRVAQAIQDGESLDHVKSLVGEFVSS